jgi:hypothetical protein
MRDLLSRLMRFSLPALLLVAALSAWSGGAQAMPHHDGVAFAGHAMPCHDDPPPAAQPKTTDQGCPDCRCLFAGCNASVALPGMTGALPIAFTLAPPLAAAPLRLATQALTGPPAEPPRV